MLDLQAVTCQYGNGFAIRDVTLRVAAGEMIGIVGPNGSGKTTLLRAISRRLRPRQGQILLEGRDMGRIPLNELARKLAVVAQMASAPPLTVEEYVLLGRIPHYGHFQFLETREDWQAAHRAMELTDCARLAAKSMTAISGGERQLALIARALAQEPSLLLLDEPTSYLDIAHQVRILDLIRRLNHDMGLTVLMVMHDLNAAAEYCERLVLMSGGRIRSAGTPEAVIDYRVLEAVYETVLVVRRNDMSGKPYVLPVSEAVRDRQRAAGPTTEGPSNATGSDLHADG